MTNRQEITRAVPLLDYEIVRGGDGRTVIAYAATFGNPYEVHDQHGHYDEVINRSAFNKVLARPGAMERVQVYFNHGKTLYGTPSDRYSMPVGVPEEIKPDGRGLLTRTRYAKTPLGDEILQLWQDGAIRSQSFIGAIYDRPNPRPGPNGRPVIERMQLGLREYGPTPSAVNADAGLVAIRSQLLERPASELTPDERRELIALLSEATDLDTVDPLVVPAVDPAPVAPVDAPDPGLSLEAIEAENANRRRRYQTQGDTL